MAGRRVERGRGDDLRADARRVREAVFVEEQGVPADLEYDEHDEAALDLVGYEDGDPVAAARLRPADEGGGGDGKPAAGKVERVAVLADRRGEGWGRRMMAAVHGAAREAGYDRLRLHAQTRVRGFYERLGYRSTGEEFAEAGMPHVAMVREL